MNLTYLSDLHAKALIIQYNSKVGSPARAAAQACRIPVIELSPVSEAEAGIFTLTGDAPSSTAHSGFSQPDDIALVLHTSGTTSRPKLVPLGQTNICVSAHNIAATLDLVEGDRCLNVMPLFHVHGLIGALLSSLAAGACVVCPPSFAVPTFFECLEVFQPTWYTAVPTIHQAILAAPKRERVARPRLRFIRSSSSALPPQLMAELERTFNAPVIESYGMTEASHQMTSNPLPPGKRKPGSVGVAAGPEVAIMDEAGKMLPAGTLGEIVIRGANVTPGYASNDAANAAAFAQGWFHTGDQGFLDSEGYLFISGRLKEIINRGGEKISPREIDEALLEHPEVLQAVAFALPHATLGEDLTAAVVLKPGTTTTIQTVREFAFERLVGHKIPSRILRVDAIPTGPTGKVQRTTLAEKLAAQLETDYVAPVTETERILACAFGEVLGCAQVGRLNNFFALGGDSLHATQVIARANAAFGLEMAPPALFRHPSVAELAEAVEHALVEQHEALRQRLAAEIEKLSEQEVERLLKEMGE